KLAQAIAPQPVEVRSEGSIAVGFDGFAGFKIKRTGGELLDHRVVVAQLDTPDVLLRVVVIGVGFIEAIATPPDAFPVVELVDGPGLLGLVVDTELDATSRAEQVGLAFAVGGRLQGPLNFLDAGNITGSTRTAVHAGDQIGGRLPALEI